MASITLTDAEIEANNRFETAWEAKLGGPKTHDLRFMLGIVVGRLSEAGVQSDDLIAYLTAVLQAEGGIPSSPLKAVPGE
jgi:hypothetical protein